MDHVDQPAFDFAAPVVNPAHVSPSGEVPFHGNTDQAKHASWTGSQAVLKTWSMRQSAYLHLLTQAGALTDQEAAALLKWNLSSVNSVRGWLIKHQTGWPRIVPVGFDLHTFTDLSGQERTTKRTRWSLEREIA